MEKRNTKGTPFKRWALHSDLFGFYALGNERLYRTRKDAVAARLNNALYLYRVVRVEINPVMKRA